jgi:hypothetical protein
MRRCDANCGCAPAGVNHSEVRGFNSLRALTSSPATDALCPLVSRPGRWSVKCGRLERNSSPHRGLRFIRTRAGVVPTSPRPSSGHALRFSAPRSKPYSNPSYVERLNLRLRRSCSYLHRRTSGRVRNPERLANVVEIVRCSYNFIRPRARLRLGARQRTPAMQAGIFDRVLSWRSIFGWPVPPPKPAALLARALPTLRLTTWFPRGRRRWRRGDSDDSLPGM